MDKRSLHFVLVALLGLATAAAARPAWKFLGERAVSDRVDHDSIAVTAAEGDLVALQLRVKGHAVQFHEVKIHYANGEVQRVELREVIPAGGSSRVIDLEGKERVVRSVELLYDARTVRGHRARVRLFGRR